MMEVNANKGKRVVMLGAGNVATHLALALQHCGYELLMVYSRTLSAACELAERLSCRATSELAEVPDADWFFFCLKDEALPHVSEQLGRLGHAGCWIHTAGSVAIDVLTEHHDQCGVVYPMQTFSKSKSIYFRNVPLFVEASDGATLKQILHLAEDLSDDVRELDSEGRKALHLSAVFACNFTNHCYALAEQLLQRHQLPRELLNPLIKETAQKALLRPAASVQTGPAIRRDERILRLHEQLLAEQPEWQQLYRLMSESIQKLDCHCDESKKSQPIK